MPTTLRFLLAALLVAGPAAPPAASAARAEPVAGSGVTTIRLTIRECDGCTVAATSVLRADYQDVWSAPEREVVDDRVRLTVPTDRTRGLSLAIDTPWADALPYQTVVALRYRGYEAGDRVRFADVRDIRRASGCWAGTTEGAVEMAVVVRRVQVAGHHGSTPGAIAFAKVTQDHLFPMQRVYEGVLGTQDVFGCGPG